MDTVQHEARYIARKLALNADTLAIRRARLNLLENDLILLRHLHRHLDSIFSQNLFETLAEQLAAYLPGETDIQELRPLLQHFFHGLTDGDFGPDHVVDRLRLGLLLDRANLSPVWLPAAYGHYLSLLAPRLGELFDRPQTMAVSQGLLKAMLLDLSLILESLFGIRPLREQWYPPRQLPHRDSLTHLPDRTLFYSLLDQSLRRAQRHQRVVAVLFVDLDGFRRINERQGYDVGDRVLEVVAERLGGCLRSNDVVARLGSDEFAVLLEDITLSRDVSRVVNKILRTLAVPLELPHHRHLFLTTSIGISLFPLDGEDPQDLLRLADGAMQQVKDRGGNSYQYYSRDLDNDALYRSNLTRLGQALDQREFVLHYQPVAAVRDLRLCNIEVLLRWNHPERGLLSPAAFLHILEENGLIVPVGQWVLRQACQQAQIWRQSGYRFATITVNISAQQFRDPGLTASIKAVLEESGLPPEQLELEISESTLMKSMHLSIHTLRELASLGVRLSMDDFGTDGASLANLIRLPLNTLKIDRGFVQDAPELLQDATLTHAAIALGQSLGLTVVAEGVETTEQLQFLRDRHCDAFQGHYLSQPLDDGRMTAFLEHNHLGKSSQPSLH